MMVDAECCVHSEWGMCQGAHRVGREAATEREHTLYRNSEKGGGLVETRGGDSGQQEYIPRPGVPVLSAIAKGGKSGTKKTGFGTGLERVFFFSKSCHAHLTP